LRLEDVLPAASAQPVVESLRKARYVAFDGLVIDVSGWEQDGKSFVQVAASMDTANSEKYILQEQGKAQAEANAAQANTAASAAAEASKPDPAVAVQAPAAPAAAFDAEKFRAEKLAALTREVDEINKRTSGWTYQIPNFKFALLSKTMADMTAPPAAAAAPPGNPLNIPLN
jgi:hypothetical protein